MRPSIDGAGTSPVVESGGASAGRRPGNAILGLAIAFFRVGVFGFGGGPSMIPLIQREIVGANRWLNEEDFLDLYAAASSLPGPIATNLAGYVGWRAAGIRGAVMAVLALCAPTGVAIVALGGLYASVKDTQIVQFVLAGVRPVVIALLLGVVVLFAPSALSSRDGRGVTLKVALVVVAFGLAVLTPIHPALLIAVGAGVGLLLRGLW